MTSDFLLRALDGCTFSILALDPGETTGFAHFVGSELKCKGQIVGSTVYQSFNQIRHMVASVDPDFVVMEDYKVYSWKTKDHAWQSLFTPRLIGALECLFEDVARQYVKRMAQEAKGFCTDDKLKAWGLWIEGQRHARDAVRHAIYHLLFHVVKIQERNKS